MLRFVGLLSLLVVTVGLFGCAGKADFGSNGWETASAEDVGLDPVLISQLIDDAKQGCFSNLHALIIAKDNRLVIEEYYGGFDANRKQYTASVTKSVGSLLVGIAMEKGLLPSPDDGVLDMKLSDLFPEYEEIITSDPRKSEIRFRHILSMSAGFEWDEQSYSYDDPRNDWVRIRDANDPIRLLLEQPVVHNPGGVFHYNGGLSTILAYLIERETNMGVADFARQFLFEPLGISDYEWRTLDCGLLDIPGGLSLRPLDMAKLGQLCLNGGMWNGKRIVSMKWIAESTNEHIAIDRSPNYGFHWWCGDFHYRGQAVYLYMASGHGGQKIFVIPEFNLVVILSHQVFDNPMGELHNNAILSRYVLPAANPSIHDNTTVEARSDLLSRYVGTYESPNDRFTIEVVDGKLKVIAENTDTMDLVTTGLFGFRGTVQNLIDVEFVFDVNDNGEVQGGCTSYAFTKDAFLRVREDSNSTPKYP